MDKLPRFTSQEAPAVAGALNALAEALEARMNGYALHAGAGVTIKSDAGGQTVSVRMKSTEESALLSTTHPLKLINTSDNKQTRVAKFKVTYGTVNNVVCMIDGDELTPNIEDDLAPEFSLTLDEGDTAVVFIEVTINEEWEITSDTPPVIKRGFYQDSSSLPDFTSTTGNIVLAFVGRDDKGALWINQQIHENLIHAYAGGIAHFFAS